jgi:tetratricopeptide (TPR) repeat protein
MSPFAKLFLFAGGAAILGVSVWGWLQVPKLLHQGLFAEFDPRHRACFDGPVEVSTEQACTWLLANETLAPRERAQALIRRGVVYNTMKRYPKAIADFDRVLAVLEDKRDPVAIAALSDRAYAEEMLGDDTKAMTDADRAIALAPDDETGYAVRSFLHGHARRFALAARDLDGIIHLKPDEAGPYNDRCFYRAIAGELPGALKDCNRALALRPQFAAALDSRGFVHFKMGEYAQARDDYDSAILAGPYSASSFYMRGLAKLKLGGTTGGEADIAQARSLEPGIAERYAGYGVTP